MAEEQKNGPRRAAKQQKTAKKGKALKIAVAVIAAIISAVICGFAGGFGSLAWLWMLPVGWLGAFLGVLVLAFLLVLAMCAVVDLDKEEKEDKIENTISLEKIDKDVKIYAYGFEDKSTTFINWELVTKKGNNAIKDSERKNLFERIAEAKRKGIEFIVIIDEEHSNKTSKASVIIDAFVAKNIMVHIYAILQVKRMCVKLR